MPNQVSLLDELRTQYEAARKSPHAHSDVPGFQEIDKQLRKAYRWLEKAFAYLDGLKPPIEHRFDLGHGLVFAAPRFEQGFVGQHEQRIVGYPVLDEINISYSIVAAAPLTIEVASGSASAAEKVLDDAGLQYTARRLEDEGGVVRKCAIVVPPTIPAAISFRADYRTEWCRFRCSMSTGSIASAWPSKALRSTNRSSRTSFVWFSAAARHFCDARRWWAYMVKLASRQGTLAPAIRSDTGRGQRHRETGWVARAPPAADAVRAGRDLTSSWGSRKISARPGAFSAGSSLRACQAKAKLGPRLRSQGACRNPRTDPRPGARVRRSTAQGYGDRVAHCLRDPFDNDRPARATIAPGSPDLCQFRRRSMSRRVRDGARS